MPDLTSLCGEVAHLLGAGWSAEQIDKERCLLRGPYNIRITCVLDAASKLLAILDLPVPIIARQPRFSEEPDAGIVSRTIQREFLPTWEEHLTKQKDRRDAVLRAENVFTEITGILGGAGMTLKHLSAHSGTRTAHVQCEQMTGMVVVTPHGHPDEVVVNIDVHLPPDGGTDLARWLAANTRMNT